MLSVLSASVIASAQTQAAERASLPQSDTEEYRLMVDEFADGIVNFAYAKHFAQTHEGSLTDRQCEQYSRMSLDYAQQLAAVRQAGVSAQSEFWNDVRAYSISMIGASGVPIPGRRTSKYSVTTGSEAGDRELRQIVSLELDEASSRSTLTGGYSPSALKRGCRTAPLELSALAEH